MLVAIVLSTLSWTMLYLPHHSACHSCTMSVNEAKLVTLETGSTRASRRSAVDIELCWAMLQAYTVHLSAQECINLRFALGVLLSRAAAASHSMPSVTDSPALLQAAEAAGASSTTHAASRALSVLTSVQSAQELLKLRLDAVTCAAAMLAGSAITGGAPTWPYAFPAAAATTVCSCDARVHTHPKPLIQRPKCRRCPVPDAFTAAVDALLVQERKLRQLPRLDRLNDSNAVPLRFSLLEGASANPRALLVLLGSRLQLLRASELCPSVEAKALAAQAAQVYAPLAQAAGMRSVGCDLEMISFRKLFPSSIRRLHQWYEQVWPDAHVLLPQLVHQLRTQLLDAPSLTGLVSHIEVYGRVKGISSTFRKMLSDVEFDAERVKDVLAMRVVLVPAADAAMQLAALMGRPQLSQAEADALLCLSTYRQALRLWNEVPGRFKDFVTRPKPNGYQSLHTNVRLADGRLAELQVRTLEMHQRAEWGAAAHGLYKGGFTSPAQLTSIAGALQAVQSLPALPAATAQEPAIHSSATRKQRRRRHMHRRRTFAQRPELSQVTTWEVASDR
uniref:RelA/SpoT domain-containing protein n=1 Tax=Calcidiscus leptoporus TaxID=127549 RepID=A0A7S0JJR0_9EUKA|mmetsp:Transcript_671/g.1526  ORF Transcript_671/g.1526 Transcript_671/m.1526 type:complete len:561 (+) Transcript_671:20-1702(+)